MDARIFAAAVAAVLTLVSASTQAGSYRTTNFVVSAPTAGMAEQIGHAAEQYRRELAKEWLGKEMPPWAQPCPITAQVAPNLGAGGATSFLFERGEVFGWRMTIQGSLERILDSVLPHEVTHTIFATHFRRPLPRWADEGACTTVEHASERNKQQLMLVDFLRTGRGIPFSTMFAMRDYPSDVMPLYSQGYSLARFLIAQGGKRKFLAFVGDGLQDENWQRAVKSAYGFRDLGELQNTWLEWVRQGSPNLRQPAHEPEPPQVASSAAPIRTVAATEHERVSEAYPTDEESSTLVPVKTARGAARELNHSRQIQPGAIAWQPKSDPFKLPEEERLAALGPDVPGRGREDQPLPGPVVTESGNYQVTRPQPTEQARQIILEWTRP